MQAGKGIVPEKVLFFFRKDQLQELSILGTRLQNPKLLPDALNNFATIMEVVGKSNAHIVLDSCLHESTVYFSNHERILKCNPYCTNVRYYVDHDVFQWVFEVKDPRDHPITAVFFVKQFEEVFSLDDHQSSILMPKLKNRDNFNRSVKRIRWDHVSDTPEFEITNPNTFVGKASSEIFLLHQKDNRTSVFFDTSITLDFQLTFPLNLMPEGILKYMSEAIMSQIMQQATESMLCRVQSDICCSDLEIAASGK